MYGLFVAFGHLFINTTVNLDKKKESYVNKNTLINNIGVLIEELQAHTLSSNQGERERETQRHRDRDRDKGLKKRSRL